jgi:hypothetical protein
MRVLYGVLEDLGCRVVLQDDFENLSDAYQKMPLVERKPFLYIPISGAGIVFPSEKRLFGEDFKKLEDIPIPGAGNVFPSEIRFFCGRF